MEWTRRTRFTRNSLMIKKMSLKKVQVRYANLSEELQIQRNRAQEASEEAEAASMSLRVEVAHYKDENAKLYKELEDIKQAAVSGGGVDAVLRQQLDVANEEIQQFKLKEVEQQQQQVTFEIVVLENRSYSLRLNQRLVRDTRKQILPKWTLLFSNQWQRKLKIKILTLA